MDFGVEKVRAAAIGIDLHRGHLDLSVATMPVRSQQQADRVIAAAGGLFDCCRSVGIPVVHVVTTYREAAEIRVNPGVRALTIQPPPARTSSATIWPDRQAVA